MIMIINTGTNHFFLKIFVKVGGPWFWHYLKGLSSARWLDGHMSLFWLADSQECPQISTQGPVLGLMYVNFHGTFFFFLVLFIFGYQFILKTYISMYIICINMSICTHIVIIIYIRACILNFLAKSNLT